MEEGYGEKGEVEGVEEENSGRKGCGVKNEENGRNEEHGKWRRKENYKKENNNKTRTEDRKVMKREKWRWKRRKETVNEIEILKVVDGIKLCEEKLTKGRTEGGWNM